MKNNATHLAMRAYLHQYYPEMAAAFENTKSETEARVLQTKYLAEARKNLAHAISEAGLDLNELMGSDPVADGQVTLQGELYEKMSHASGKDIKAYVETLLYGINSVTVKDNDPLKISYKIVGAFSCSFGAACGISLIRAMSGMAGWTFSVTVQAVSAATVAVVTAACALIVLSIFVPLLYFVFKPAQSVLCFINDLKHTVELVDYHAVHGKINTTTKLLHGKMEDKEDFLNGVWYAGIFGAEKREGALIGTECGFTFSYTDEKTREPFTFGVGIGCPLTHKNMLYCGFNQSAQVIAESMSTDYGLYREVAYNNYRLSISLNSEHDSPAFFIARIYKV